jgi:hypothetical protein
MLARGIGRISADEGRRQMEEKLNPYQASKVCISYQASWTAHPDLVVAGRCSWDGIPNGFRLSCCPHLKMHSFLISRSLSPKPRSCNSHHPTLRGLPSSLIPKWLLIFRWHYLFWVPSPMPTLWLQ